MSDSSNSLPPVRHCVTAEVVGTFLLVFLGCGAVHAAVLFGAQSGLWQVAVVWGVAIMLAIYAIGGISGAHINPAITLSAALWGGFPSQRVAAYIGAQLLGAFLAAAMLYAIFGVRIAALEKQKGITRGETGSEVTACVYCEFYPAPGGLASGDEPLKVDEFLQQKQLVTHQGAFLAEVLGTAILAMLVFAMGDAKNAGHPGAKLFPIFVGLTVAVLISVIAPLTQACFNPARDFGPRLFTSLVGWGPVTFPIGRDWGWLTVYIVAPIVGAIAGGGFYSQVLKPIYVRQWTENDASRDSGV